MRLLLTYTFIVLSLAMVSCEKEISIDIPQYDSKIVVDGRIEQGLPPIVFLSRSYEFFGETDLTQIQNDHVSGATVVVSNGTVTDTLLELCTQSLPPGIDTLVAEFLGVDVSDLALFNICAYVGTDLAIFGEVGKSYSLTIDYENTQYTSTTRIPELVALDSVWWEKNESGSTPTTDYGFSWAILSDPDTLSNAYRWYARRLNVDQNGDEKDPQFLLPFGAQFDDEFINNQTFEFAYERPNSENDGPDDKRGYYREGDTVVIKFCSIEFAVCEYLRSAETQALNAGSPFASPANNPTNIEGGALGLWAGYGVTYDTLIAE